MRAHRPALIENILRKKHLRIHGCCDLLETVGAATRAGPLYAYQSAGLGVSALHPRTCSLSCYHRCPVNEYRPYKLEGHNSMMDTSSEISDPTQWLETPLSLLAPLESALRCQVCKEFFNNPVITSCCHTFCSLCIRRCLSAEGKCPACRSPDQELKLRRNWAVQELVDAFQTARPSVLDFSRETAQLAQAEEQAGEPLHKKRKVTQVEEHVQTSETSSQGRRTRSQRHQLQVEESPAFDTSPQVIEDSQDEDEYVPGMSVTDYGSCGCLIALQMTGWSHALYAIAR